MPSIESIIERQLRRWELQKLALELKPTEKPRPRPIITVSRGFGAGGEDVARKLSQLTGFQLMDREIFDAIIGDIGIQNKLVELMDEKAHSEVEAWVYGMFTGRIIDSTDYLKSLAKILGSVLKYGETILVGRGSNVIIGMDKGFHVRVTASLKTRVGRIAERENLTRDKAMNIIAESDKRKTAYFKKSFGADINDPSHYDIVLNTDYLSTDDAVELALLAYSKKEKILFSQ